MVRHLERLTEGVAFALDTDQLSRGSLALLHPSNPGISMTAAMQFSMGTRSNQVLDGPDFNANIINEYLGSSFGIMQRYGEEVFRPFMEVWFFFPCEDLVPAVCVPVPCGVFWAYSSSSSTMTVQWVSLVAGLSAGRNALPHRGGPDCERAWEAGGDDAVHAQPQGRPDVRGQFPGDCLV